ncbi:uncharacterized protein ARMOST_08275 [Armillaria ostoyae]|uniref:NAD(P)-binding domain-containing protein n=1 Tax=Armillaria ostoyae TaxID=47428 RepID=A0A284R883_ARMOS|nr:uncharacterized protein ARMOST_08275 [Armillaria ostoyae]
MPYYFIHGTEETTDGIGGYPVPSAFHVAYPYDASDAISNTFDMSIAQHVKDIYSEENQEATAMISSYQSESDVSSASAESQSDQSLDDQMEGIVNAPSSLPAQETLSVPAYVEERIASFHQSLILCAYPYPPPQPPEYPFLFTTRPLVKKRNSHKLCIQASSKPPSDKPYEVKICSPPQDSKQIPEALGQVKYKFRTPGLSPYNRHLIWFKDPTVPSDTPGIVWGAEVVLKAFIDYCREKGVVQFVLLSASVVEPGGPAAGKVHDYLARTGVEYCVLRPMWFIEVFSEQHRKPIKPEDKIYSATGDRKVPFVSAEDIAVIAFRALVDPQSHNTDYFIRGSELLWYGEVAEILTRTLGVQMVKHIQLRRRVTYGPAASSASPCPRHPTHCRHPKRRVGQLSMIERPEDIFTGRAREPHPTSPYGNLRCLGLLRASSPRRKA